MVNRYTYSGLFIALLAMCIPFSAHAQLTPALPATSSSTIPNPSGALLRDGIFGCSASKYQNIGALSAMGGVYVPVYDAAVTLNTGYLVYKECVLDGVIASVKEAATSEIVRAEIKALTTARNGNPQYVVNPSQEYSDVRDQTFAAQIQNNNDSVICSPFRSTVRTQTARNYMQQKNNPNAQFACTLPGTAAQQQAFLKGDFKAGGIVGLLALADPSNRPDSSQREYEERIGGIVARSEDLLREQLQWGRGFLPQYDNNPDPLARRIVTPGFIISETAQQLLGSGFRQLENATEIDQIVGSLFSGMASRVLTDRGGLTGLNQASNGQAAYIDRLVAESSARVREQSTSAGYNVLGPSRIVEAHFKSMREKLATSLTTEINRLRSAEALCWKELEPKVRLYAQNNGYPTLKVATTTAFAPQQQPAQAIISSEIAELATRVAGDIEKSAATLSRIDQIIAQLSGSSLATAQRIALGELDQLIARGALRTSDEAKKAEEDASPTTGIPKQINSRVNEILDSWAGGPQQSVVWNGDVKSYVGWCNYANEATLKAWADKWRQ